MGGLCTLVWGRRTGGMVMCTAGWNTGGVALGVTGLVMWTLGLELHGDQYRGTELGVMG